MRWADSSDRPDWLLEKDTSVREVVGGRYGADVLFQFNAPICAVRFARLTNLYFSSVPVNRPEAPAESGSGVKQRSLDVIDRRAMPVAITIGKDQTSYE